MARIRSIKPEFFTDEKVGALAPISRIFFTGLWCHADREGRLEDRPRELRIKVVPYDSVDADDILSELASAGLVVRYEVLGRRFIAIRGFLKHQLPHYKEIPSVIPAPPGHDAADFVAFPVSKAQRARLLGTGAKCAHCEAADALTVDHITPVSEGGASDDSNLQVLCRGCNSSKGNRESPSTQRRVNVDSTSPNVESTSHAGRERLSVIGELSSVNGSGGREAAHPPPFRKDPFPSRPEAPKPPDKPAAPSGSHPPPTREDPFPLAPEKAKPPSKPEEAWAATDFWQWAQFKREEAKLLREPPVKPPRLDEWWRQVGGLEDRISRLKEGFLRFGDDPFWQQKEPPLPFHSFMVQWAKYVPQGGIHAGA